MKTIIKTFFATMVALFTTTVLAVDPVAVWSGFNNLESGTFTADIGSLVPDAKTGAVTLGSNGIKFANSGDAWAGSTKGWTVAVKYSTFASGTAAALVSLQQNSETSAAGIDKIGAWVNANGKVQGLWQAGSYGTANGTLPASGVFFVRYNDGNGTSVHMQNSTSLYAAGGLKSSGNNWGKSFAVGSFANGTSNVAAGLTVEAVAIFDSRVSDADMAAYAFPDPIPAEYETVVLTNDNGTGSLGGVGTYRPDALLIPDSSGIEAGKIVKVKSVTFVLDSSSAASADSISINGEPSSSKTISGTWPNTSYPLVTYNYGDGVDIEIGKSAPMVASGDSRWRLFANVTDPDRMYIGMTNTTDMNKGYRPAYKIVVEVPVTQKETIGEIVSYNIYQSAADGQPGKMVDALADQISVIEDADGNAIAIPAAQWNQNSGIGSGGYNTISNAKFYNPTTKTSGTTAISIGSRAADSSNYGYAGKNDGEVIPGEAYTYLKSWLAMKNTGAANQTYVSVSDIAYEKYDLYIYFNGSKINTQSNTTQFLPFKFGAAESSATYYTVSDGALVATTNETTPKWGAREQTTATLWTNAVVIPNQTSPTIYLQTLGASGGIAAFQIVEKVGGKKKVEVDCGTEYSMSDANAVTGDTITLKFADAGGTLLIDEAPTRKYTIKCAGAMEILGDDDYTITQTDFNKLTLSQVSGGLTIDATGGLEMNDAIKSAIKAATADKTYTFIGDDTNGVTIDFGNWNGTLGTHLAFVGGAHTFKWQNGGGSGGGTKFGTNGSVDNPTIWVKNGATLDFYGKDISGWHCAADMNGVLKVDNGARLNLRDNGGTFFFSAKLYLEPGSETHVFTTGQNLRFNGGYDVNKQQLYVPASEGGVAKIVIESNASINIGQENNPNAAAFVGAGSTLRIEGAFGAVNNSRELAKYGEGKLVITGNVTPKLIINAGSLGLNGTVNDLTFGAEGVLNLDNGAPTVTGSLVTATEKQLKLAITPPVLHGMSVITLPDAADKTGWTAYVNGREAENELIAEGNTLKLKWKIPPTVGEIDPEADIEAKPSVDYTKSTVSVKVNYSGYGDYAEGDMDYQIIIGEKTYKGFASGEDNAKTVTFDIDGLEGGKIYRGEFQVIYGEDSETAATAPIVIRQGKLIYAEKDPWVNETPNTFKTTGTYDPASGVSVVDNMIQINTNTQVTFTPTPDPDYVDKCDSSFTISIIADEAIDADSTAISEDDKDAQAGVQIVADGSDGVKFQFIVGDEWIDGPDAELNKLYDVAISFHYAKGDVDGDEDSVTYTVGEWTRSYNRRENTANKVEEIIFYDGTQFASLIGTCQIEKADPVPQGLKPGEEAEIKADNDEDAQEQAKKMPVLIPDDELVVAALDTDAKKDAYKALFKVIAVKKNESYTAEVMFADEAIPTIKEEEDDILSEVVAALGSLVGEEGTLENIKGQPGLYYGIAADGELVNMGEAQPEEWKIADKDGNIVGLKVKKTANAKQGFYKVICTPVKPATK